MTDNKKPAKPVRPKPKIGPSTDKKSKDTGVTKRTIRPGKTREK